MQIQFLSKEIAFSEYNVGEVFYTINGMGITDVRFQSQTPMMIKGLNPLMNSTCVSTDQI